MRSASPANSPKTVWVLPMSTARSIALRFYLIAVAGLGAAGCKKKSILDDPGEHGKLSRIAARLEEGLGDKPMPAVPEPEKLADRLARWDDFRSCTVRAYVARKRVADEARRAGLPPPGRHASVGEAAVEECAVQAAVLRKDRTFCERLAVDFGGPSGDTPLSAVRCWDTRARVLGVPDECPVVWLPDDLPGRNAECLAAARRDASLCPFAENPARCRALVAGDVQGCEAAGAAEDCPIAVTYWSGLIPAPLGPPLVDLTRETRPGERPVFATVDVRWPKREHPTIRIEGPQAACGVSWPAGKARPAWTEDTTEFWGARIPSEAVQITWRAGQPAVKIAFVPAGNSSGVRPVQPPGSVMAATVALVWPDPRAFRRCLPGPQTTGHVRFDAGAAQPGSFVTGSVEAEGLSCSDGSSVDVSATFRLVILDVR